MAKYVFAVKKIPQSNNSNLILVFSWILKDRAEKYEV